MPKGMHNSRMKYGQRLQDALHRAGRTRKQLAAELGVSPQAIGMVLNGAEGVERKFSAVNNEKAAAYLGISRLWLLTGEDEPDRHAQKISGLGLDALIDLLPQNDLLLRAQVFAQASQLIITAVVDSRKTQAQPTDNRAEKQL
jgi:transcriptional regulator with XRE-family HTH domain